MISTRMSKHKNPSSKEMVKAIEKIDKAFVKQDFQKVYDLCLDFFKHYGRTGVEVHFYYVVSLIETEQFDTALEEIGSLLAYTSPYEEGVEFQGFENLHAILRHRMGGDAPFIEACRRRCEEVRQGGVYEHKSWSFVLTAFTLLIVHEAPAAQEAIALIHEAQATEPQLKNGYLACLTEGLALAHLGQTDEGTQVFERAYQEHNLTMTMPHLDMASICSTGGSIFLAQQYYKKAERCKDFCDDDAASIGDFFFDFGLHQYTAYWYSQITEPELRADILPALAYTYYKLGDERTLDTLSEAVAIDPLAVQELFKADFNVSDAHELISAVSATFPHH